MKISVFIAISLIFLSFVVQADVTVDKTEVNVAGGDSFFLVYNISGPKAKGNMSITILPDGIGFNVTYPTVIDIPSTINVSINTSSFLMPGNYTIIATFYSDYVQPEGPTKRVHHHHAAILEVQNETQNETAPPDNELPEDNETNETHEPNIQYEAGFDAVPLAVGTFIIILIEIFGFLILRKKLKKGEK